MTDRRSLSPMRKLAVFERALGICHLCERRIRSGEKWELEHIRAIGLLGADDETNMAPAHVECHAPKTADDVARIAKAKRQAASHWNIKQSKRPMDGSKASPWRKRMSGKVELR